MRHVARLQGGNTAYFNPRTRVGATASHHHASLAGPHFNPRTRVVRRAIYGAESHKNFNPRTRVGYDRAHCPACGLIGSYAVPNIPHFLSIVDNRTSFLARKVRSFDV